MPSNKLLTLSLVIPAYNEESHLEACLNAVAQQTEMPDEVIVVDNNSTDRTVEIAKRYPFVRIVTEKRQGHAWARDAGFAAAKSDILCRIDADTHLSPGWVKRVKEFYSVEGRENFGLSGGCYFYNVPFPRFCGWWQGQIAFRMNRLLLGHYILFGSNMAMPKAMWEAVRPHVCHDREMHEDIDLAIHVHRAGYEITYKESLRVGVEMRRVFENREQLWHNMMWWPLTPKKHGLKTWVFGWIGGLVLYVGSFAFILVRKPR